VPLRVFIRFPIFTLARAGAKPPKPASARHSLSRFVSPRLFIFLYLFFTCIHLQFEAVCKGNPVKLALVPKKDELEKAF